jgi:hypothetical protein
LERDGTHEEGWTLDRLTEDPILARYKFCNVYRELDRVTVWIREHIREPYSDHPKLWFMLCAARIFNWPPSLAELIKEGAWPDQPSFAPADMTRVMSARRARGDQVETGAYMIRANCDTGVYYEGWNKQRYLCEVVLGHLWVNSPLWEELLDGATILSAVWTMFQLPFFVGWGPFMAYQAVIDMRWTRYLRDALDINSWTALGPGSRRGLNRLYGNPVSGPLTQQQGLEKMVELRDALHHALAPWVPVPDLSDVQNCLCEFDKYERVRLGQGRPRSLYHPGRIYTQ